MALFDRLVGGLDKVIHSFARDSRVDGKNGESRTRLVQVFSCGGVDFR